MRSGVGSSPKDGKSFCLMEKSLFQKFYITFLYEIEIVTFPKTLKVMIDIGGYLFFILRKVGEKRKRIYERKFEFETYGIHFFWLTQEKKIQCISEK